MTLAAAVLIGIVALVFFRKSSGGKTVAPMGPVDRLAGVLRDGPPDSAGAPLPPLSPGVVEGLAPLVEFLGPGTTEERAVRGLMAWTWLFGAVSLELFGQLTGAVSPERRTEVFDAEARGAGAWLGLPA